MRNDPAILSDSDLLTWRHWSAPLGWFAALGMLLVAMPHLGSLFAALDPEAREPIYRRDAFVDLLANHLLLVAGASSIAILSGVSAAIMVTRPWGRDFLPLVSQLASIGQTFPPVAVLALAVPWLGFGGLPTVVALVLYGLLPVVRNTLVGIGEVDPATREAARGMGMSPRQVLWQLELPLAAPVILAGIRTSVTVGIATAAIGSTIGAKTLGDPIIAGIINGNTAYILQGAILIGVLALSIDSVFARLLPSRR
ncbi:MULTISPECIES: ABC transporter permease [Halomonadaceae]|uniref:ABC transporter permease n=1 Tax=Halomonadaceae TaxID=28256 RepID=UPI001583998A|nr:MULTISPECIES: ABC transporter permease [Halomonas]NUJ60389.1 ABC transporter permease [Halomonas taeanensis]|tara:strand:+ start:4151 stop:4912 length:762 start_codon:yes stop_codon:yes gene_type:complete